MSSAPAISIAVETPLSDEMRVMVGELNDLLLSLTSEDACHHLTVEQMADARTTVFVARVDGKVAACGSLYRHDGGIAEVKRMYTRPGLSKPRPWTQTAGPDPGARHRGRLLRGRFGNRCQL
jgi:putative acetyltransferase